MTEQEISVRFHAPIRDAAPWPADLPLPPEPFKPVTPPVPVVVSAPAASSPLPAPPHDRLREEVQDLEQLCAKLNALIGQSGRKYEEMLLQLQDSAIELATAVARKLLHQHIEAGTFPVEQLVREVVARLPRHSPLVIKLNPADLALLHQVQGQDRSLQADRSELTLVADPGVLRGGCQAECEDWRVVADLDEQLADIRQRLLGSVHHA